MSDKKANLILPGGEPNIEFPIHTGTIGPDAVDIRALLGKTGKVTYDQGFCQLLVVVLRLHTSMAMKVYCSTEVTLSSNWLSIVTF